MKLSQRLDVIVVVLIILYVLAGCTTAEVLDTMSKFNAEKSTYSPYGCLEDEVLWCEGHDRNNSDCMCVERTIMENRSRQLKRF